MSKISEIQTIVGVDPDGIWGPKSQLAFDELLSSHELSAIHKVKATSFADPKDIEAFKKCKAHGKTDNECFKVGDNGIGKWGDDTTADTPMVALPPEDWQGKGFVARGKKVLVTAGNKSVIAELRDTMPHRANIKNGAGIDCNPATCKALDQKIPADFQATWQWA